jgi:hypothetical protein
MPVDYDLLRRYSGASAQPSPYGALTNNTAAGQDYQATIAELLGARYGLAQPDAYGIGTYPVSARRPGGYLDNNNEWHQEDPEAIGAGSVGYGGATNPYISQEYANQHGGVPGVGVVGGGGAGGDGNPMAQVLAEARRVRNENQGYIDEYAGWAMPGYDAANARATQSDQDRLAWQSAWNDSYRANDANALGAFGSAVGTANANDQATFGNLRGLYGGIQPVQLAGYQGAGPSRAAGAYADPSSIAAQRSFLNQFQGVANGSLNGVSQAAGAYADPASIAAQTRALNSLFGAAGGALNVTSQGAQAFADPTTIEGQRAALEQFRNMAGGGMDLESLAAQAGADPESIEAQKYALGKYKGWSDPTVTAEERFIMELARRNEEQDRRAAMDAHLRDLDSRGVRGSGAETGAFLGAQQTTSQNRLLQDLGAEANAVARAERSLGAYTGLATDIRGQSFTEDFNKRAAGDAMNVNNRDVRIRGIENDASLNTTMRNQSFSEAYQRGVAMDTIAAGNANRQLSATGMAGDLASQQRSQSFNETFNRGAAADNMYNQNANRQFAGMQAGFGAASDMRNSSFAEEFNRGQAADVQTRFNQGQQQQYNQFAANFGLQQNNDVWGRGLQPAGVEGGLNNAAYGRSGDLFGATVGLNQTDYGRTQDWLGAVGNASNGQFGRDVGRIGLGGDILGQRTGNNIATGSQMMDAWRGIEAQRASQAAIASIPKDKGLLGLGINVPILDWKI